MLWVVAAVVLVLVAGSASAQERAKTSSTTICFDKDKAGAPLPVSCSAALAAGRWGAGSCRPRRTRRAPNLLAQLDADGTDSRSPVAVADTPVVRDIKLSVRCKPVSGHADQACGLVWRYRDANNDHLTRANALEDDVRLCSVKDGRRKQIEKWSGPVRSGVWHTFAIEALGEAIAVYFDGTKVMEAKRGIPFRTSSLSCPTLRKSRA